MRVRVRVLVALLTVSCACAQVVKLVPSGGATGDNFGTSLGISADRSTMVVGAQWYDSTSTDAGVVYVFHATPFSAEPSADNGITWGNEVRLLASDAATGDRLGLSAAVNGDGSVVAGGSADAAGGAGSAGAVYVFTRSGTGKAASDWSQSKVVAETREENALYGGAVALSDDGRVLVVGAYGARSSAGDVYVVRLAADGSALAQSRLQGSDIPAGARLGRSVEVSSDGTLVVAGADRDTFGNAEDAGSVTVWRCAGDDCAEVRKLRASDAQELSFFGTAVSVDADGALLAVGAPRGNGRRGAVYVYSTTTWRETRLVASDATAFDGYGYSVSLAPNGLSVAVGARENGDVGIEVGKAYVYSDTASGWLKKMVSPSGASGGAFFGHIVALHGSALLVSAYQDGSRFLRGGAVFSYSCAAGSWLNMTSGDCAACAAGAECQGVVVEQACPGGYYAVERAAICTPCPPNTACPVGATAPSLCPAGNRAARASSRCTECRDTHRLEPAADGETCQFKSALGVPQEPIIVLGVMLVFVVPLAVGSAGLSYRDILTFVIATADIMSDVLYVTTQPFVNPVVHFAAIGFLVLPWLVMNLIFPPKVCNRPVGWLDVHGLAKGRQRGLVESIREAYAAEYERLLQPPTRAGIEAARELFGSLLEDLVEFFKDTFLDLDSRFWRWPPKSYNNWDTPKQVAMAPVKALVFVLVSVVTGVVVVVGALYFVVAVLLCVLLTPVWAIFQALMFLFAPVLPVIARAVYGQFLLLTKLVSVQKASDHWLPWWRGERVSSTVSSRVFAKLVYIELVLESVPQLVIQSVNNVGQWNPFAYASLALSIVVVLHTLRVIAKNMVESDVTIGKNRGVWEQAKEAWAALLGIKFLVVARAEAAKAKAGGPAAAALSTSSSRSGDPRRGSLELLSF